MSSEVGDSDEIIYGYFSSNGSYVSLMSICFGWDDLFSFFPILRCLVDIMIGWEVKRIICYICRLLDFYRSILNERIQFSSLLCVSLTQMEIHRDV